MHSTEPAQGKGVDSCQFRGVLEMPGAITLFHRGKTAVAAAAAAAAGSPPFPRTPSPFCLPARRQTG